MTRAPDTAGKESEALPGMRLDKWLWYARLAPTRGKAQALCHSGHLRMDGEAVTRAGKIVHPDATLAFTKGARIMVVRVAALASRRGPYSEARLLYETLIDDRTAPPPDV